MAALDSARHGRGIIDQESRFSLHGLKHRGITDSEDKASGRHLTEAMRQLYDHSVQVMEAAVKPKKPASFPGRSKKASAPRRPSSLKPLFSRRFGAPEVVPLIRIERMTYCLQDSCSTN